MVGEIIASVSLLSAEEQEEQGVLYCDGTDRLRSSYPDLFAVIGVSFGSTGETTFNLPDYRNAYLKGSDEVRSVGSHQHSNNKSHYHVCDPPENNVTSWDENNTHDHSFSIVPVQSGSGSYGIGSSSTVAYTSAQRQNHAHRVYYNMASFNSSSEGSDEANVYNFPVYFYIRAVDYVKKTYDMLFALIDANCSKDESGVYDYTKLGKWVVGSGATERTLYLSEQLRQVLAYNYGGLV